MASNDEPPQSREHQNSSKALIRHIIPSLPPAVDYTKDLHHHYFYDEVFPFALSPWNQHSTELSLRKVASSYPGNTVYRILLNCFQNRGYHLSEYYWNMDDYEFVIRTKGEFKDPVEQLINQSFHNHQNLLNALLKYSTEVDEPLNIVKRALPNQMLVCGAMGRKAVLTGFFKGRYTRKFAVTVAHVVDKLGEKLYAGEELLGYCCFKNKVMQIADQIYTTDLALIAVDPKSRHARDKHTVIEIQGQRYQPKLCSIAQIYDIKPGSEVWIVDQYESLKMGRVFRHFYNNERLELHNVIQVMRTDGKALTIEGDSGCCVCLPPKPHSDVIEIFGVVKGVSIFHDKTTCTNAVLLPIVLKHMLRNLPPNLKKVEYFCEAGRLPANVDLSEELDFYIGEKSEILAVESENSIEVQSEENITVQSENSIEVQSEKNITVQSENSIEVQSEKNITVQSENSIAVQSEQSITVQSENSIDSIVVESHDSGVGLSDVL